MSSFLEALESRMFLSVSPLVGTLHDDEAAAKASLGTLKADGAAALKTITVDLKGAAIQSVAKAQVKGLATALKNIGAGDAKTLGAVISKVNADVNKLESLRTQLSKKPGNPALTAKVDTAVSALTSAAAAGLSAFHAADEGTALEAAINYIIDDGGQTDTDATNAIATLSADSQTMSTAADQAFTIVVSAIIGP